MSTLLNPPPKSVTPLVRRSGGPPAPRLWSSAELSNLMAAGAFAGERIMLLDGVIYDMPVANPPHDTGLEAMFWWLNGVFQGKHYVRNQLGFNAGTASNPAPDLAVVEGNYLDYKKQPPSKALLIVEIADSSLYIDTGKKAALYASAGLPDYWVLDVDNRQLHVFREPQSGTYASHVILNEGETIAPLAAPGANITAKDLLPSAAE